MTVCSDKRHLQGGGKHAETQKLLLKLQELEKLCFSLQEENKVLKSELNSIKTTTERSTTPILTEVEYHTDEEQLERETKWVHNLSKRANKKRKMESSPEIDPPTQKEQVKLPELRPPPIILTNPKINHQQLQKKLKDNINNDFIIKLIGKDIYKINVQNGSDYRKITKIFTELMFPWHSYENKQTRQIRVMVKDLHHTCQPEDIIEDLQRQGLKATNAYRKLKWKTKEPLNMFTLCFDPNEDIKKVYEIKNILNTIVKIEQLKLSNLIPQCKSCQGFMHPKNYCCNPPKCVKCAGNHSTLECKKPDKEPPKCCNCGQNHPASYRGCHVAKELQKLRNKSGVKHKEETGKKPSTAIRQALVMPKRSVEPRTTKKPTLIPGKQTYADVAAQKENTTDKDILTQILFKIEKQLTLNQVLLNRVEKLEQIINV